MLTSVRKCRVCGRESLEPVLDLGNQYLSGQFVRSAEEPVCERFPLEMMRCLGCGLVQLRHSIDLGSMYNRYWYRSGINDTMRLHLAEVAQVAVGSFRGERLGAILDIGCNDGTLMSALRNTNPSVRLVGIDPSNAVEDASVSGIYRGFFPQDLPEQGLFDLVFSLACFYDVEDPVAFAKAVRQRLSPQGFWVIEVASLIDILRNHAYDTVCHEHLEYYSFDALEYILGRAGLEVWDVSHTDTNGGSLLVCACLPGAYRVTNEVGTVREEEAKAHGCPGRAARRFASFSRGVEERLDELHNLLARLHGEGKRIHVYGASTKGNVILQSADIVGFVECCADRNPQKWGCHTLGTNLPIVSEEESRRLKPDYYLALPWAFRKEFTKREKGSGIPMIFPLPKVSVWLNNGDSDGRDQIERDQDPFRRRCDEEGWSEPFWRQDDRIRVWTAGAHFERQRDA